MKITFSKKAGCAEGNVLIGTIDEPEVCESCGTLNAFEAVVGDGGTCWCMDCVEGHDDMQISDEDKHLINLKCRDAEDAYVLKKYKSIKSRHTKRK